ncbi:uroporphyrin-III C-methyltransferase [Flavisolibacter ginsengisoli DSM 18119]|jgi:uroporphyrin-III C-methyltransferase/precorrin-2 dehydrogenase/sirohydrochlorin ferrochelatase/uroporphyrin-III C-methyltransferase|uniref:uroporphyrinogen-III C-methyltransferase n=2 Tax=Flavisolibacter TaxID=398041 RepID=A0A1M4UPW6_9BACT|nr:uroporphyrin-III C-methyltransferase [Flavisolibacter ginsengisoli DSM 18119]
MPAMNNMQKGKVYIVGAGCGDPDLITVKGMRLLQQADIVLTDRLASPEIIERYTIPDTEVVYVGKQCRKGESTPQATINELMVLYANEGKTVVRLKGGDVSMFSNILDELEVLHKYSIPFEIVPGITAALGAAAYAGIPLTARNYATAVRFLTAYRSDVVLEEYWKELAQTDDTLVFYMSSETLPDVISNLVRHAIDPARLLAIIEQATTPFQKIYTGSLYEFEEKWEHRNFLSPSLVIIGKVVSLHDKFDWFNGTRTNGRYFDADHERNRVSQESFGLTA